MYNDDGQIRQIRIVVIYTADVKRGTTNHVLDLGACRLTIDEAFLSDLDSAEIRSRIIGKLERGEALDDIDLMQLIIYPLTYDGLGAQQRAVSEAIDLAERISDGERAHFTLAAINVFSDKIITERDRERIKESISMTKLGREYWQEAHDTGKIEGIEEGRDEERLRVVENCLRKGMDLDSIVSCTGLTPEEVRELQDRISITT